MKQKDIVLLILVAVVAAVISFFVSGMLFGTPASRQQDVEDVKPISASLDHPDEKYFNDKAIDPTQPITIGPNANPAPFNVPQPE